MKGSVTDKKIKICHLKDRDDQIDLNLLLIICYCLGNVWAEADHNRWRMEEGQSSKQTFGSVKLWNFVFYSIAQFWYVSLFNHGIILLETLLINILLWYLDFMHFQVDPYPKDPDPPVKMWRIRNLLQRVCCSLKRMAIYLC